MAFNTEGLLASIGRGLKLGAGVMNPQIYEEQGRERLLAEQQAQARKDQMFQLVFAGVQNGSIPQEQGKDILLKLRPELAGQLPDGAIGPTQKVLDAQQERAANAEWKTQHNINPYLGDDIAKLEYERANPKPPQPTEIERLMLARDRALAEGKTGRAKLLEDAIRIKTTRERASEALVEVYDPTSPTGTIMLPRSQATGRAGKPPSGWNVEVGPNGEVQITQGRSPTGVQKTELKDLRNAEVSTRNFIATANDAQKLFAENPDVNTFVAKGAGAIRNLRQEGDALARALGKDFDDRSLDPVTFAKEFDSLGIDNFRMQSLITSLAFQAAAASGSTGRDVSDKDVKRFIVEIGAAARDPEAFNAVLEDVKMRVQRNFMTNYEVRMGKPYSGTLGGQGQQKNPAPNGEVFIIRGQKYRKIGVAPDGIPIVLPEGTDASQ